MPQLAKFGLQCDMSADSRCAALAEVLPKLPMLASFDATNCSMTAAGFTSIVIALGSCTALTELDLSKNAAGVDGARALAESLCALRKMQALRSSGCNFTAPGVVAVAHALQNSCAHLRECNLQGNYLTAGPSCADMASVEAFISLLPPCAPWDLHKLSLAGTLAPQSFSAAECGLVQALRDPKSQQLRELKLCDTQLVPRGVDAQAAAQWWEDLLSAALSLPALEELDFSNTSLTHATVCAAIPLLNAAPALEGFVIAHNALPDASLRTLIVDWAGTDEYYNSICSSAEVRRVAAHTKRCLRNSLVGNSFSMPTAGLRPSVFNIVTEDEAIRADVAAEASFTHCGDELSREECTRIRSFTFSDAGDHVHTIRLHQHRLSGTAAYLLRFFRWRNVRQLHLTNCSIDDVAMEYLAWTLGNSRHLSHLDLTGNALSHAGVGELVKAWMQRDPDHAQLRVLRLVGNQIGSRGAQWLAYLYLKTQQPQQPSVTEHDVGRTGWQILVPLHAAMLGDEQMLAQ